MTRIIEVQSQRIMLHSNFVTINFSLSDLSLAVLQVCNINIACKHNQDYARAKSSVTANNTNQNDSALVSW